MRRAGFVAGVVAILALTGALAFWLLRTDYDVLFANLSPQDAAAMTGELDRMKLPYRLGADGSSILVDRSTVHATRLKLMGKDLPLHGAVGFELFNNADFGMTEFAQKINYQRALQGELTRTILSLAEVESARVHLAFPDEGLFKRDQARAKAAITLALRRGETLRPEQVAGIQRLVAAAVNGIAPADVTIVNQQGVALTRGSGDAVAGVSSRLELKTEIEQALGRKVARVLERSFGEGNVLASVDVTLDMNQVRVTTEDVRGHPEKPGETPTGVIVRERETIRDESTASVREAAGGASFREIDYQVGRRVEQVVSQPGSIQKLQVVAVIKDALEPAQLNQVKALIAASVGALPDRGDTVVVHAMGSFSNSGANAGAAALPTDEVADARLPARPAPSGSEALSPLGLALLVLAGLLLVIAVVWLTIAGPARTHGVRSLSTAEREAALLKLRQWLDDGGAQATEPVRREAT
jgi:flagellar M-ring protein FliF